jgi:ubiquinone/menaquinone biosynthesis C-methylase UbiE
MQGRLDNTDLIVNERRHPLGLSQPAAIYNELYPWYPNASFASFNLVIPHALQDLRTQHELVVQPVSRATGETSTHPLELLLDDLNFEMPPAEVAARIGATNRSDYTILGRSIYRAFERALQKNFNNSFSGYKTILDWGCGSGRVARHVVTDLDPGQRFRGFDIDAFAVEWANGRFGGHFHQCSTAPPLAVDTGSIDLVYAYSVLTHLADRDMKAWLAEMARVIQKDGVFLFTVLSDVAMVSLFPVTDRNLLSDWSRRGIFDSLANAQLDTIDVARDYYRNVWLKRDYIKKSLGATFEVVDFIPGFHFYQSLVVARRR